MIYTDKDLDKIEEILKDEIKYLERVQADLRLVDLVSGDLAPYKLTRSTAYQIIHLILKCQPKYLDKMRIKDLINFIAINRKYSIFVESCNFIIDKRDMSVITLLDHRRSLLNRYEIFTTVYNFFESNKIKFKKIKILPVKLVMYFYDERGTYRIIFDNRFNMFTFINLKTDEIYKKMAIKSDTAKICFIFLRKILKK